MINLKTREAKLRYWQQMTRSMLLIESAFTNRLKRLIGKQYTDAAIMVAMGITDIDSTIDNRKSEMLNLWNLYYRRIASTFGKKVNDEIEKRSMNIEEKTVDNDFWRILIGWIRLQSAKKVKYVDNTTKKNIKKIIEKGIIEGYSHKKIAKEIKKIKEIAIPFRAKRIARTETHTAAVKSTDSAIKSTMLLKEKEWLSAKSERTRRKTKSNIFDHYIADGERVPIDGFFTRTGEALEFPGDPNGSAGNIINCRCVTLYHTQEQIREE